MAWIKYKENCVINSDRILDIRIVSTKVYPKGDLEWAINFRDCEGCQFTIESFVSKEECEQMFNYIIEAIGTKSYIDMTKVLQNSKERVLMTEEYLLNKGFTKDFNDLLNEESFVSLNNQVTVWRNYDNVPSPYDWYVIINKDDNTRGSLDIAYVDEFESFLKLCGVDYGEK